MTIAATLPQPEANRRHLASSLSLPRSVSSPNPASIAAPRDVRNSERAGTRNQLSPGSAQYSRLQSPS